MDHAELFRRSLAVTPGGVHSPVRAFHGVGGTPVFFRAGHGARLVDVDGREYIDFCQSFGPLILGHRDPDVSRAAHAALDDGWSFGACEPYSLELAGSGLAGRVAASSAGIPDGTIADTIAAPLDDDEALEQVFDTAGAEIAAAVIEPLPANYGLLPQRAEWLQRLAARCREAGALVVFDEVITGFRVGLQGMSGALGIRPDLVCYGKVMGGGFPVAAYAGRADLLALMAPEGPVYQAGTLSANPVGMRAGLAALQKMERTGGWAELERRASGFVDGLGARLGAGVEIVRRGSIFWIRLAADAPVRRPRAIPARQAEWYSAFFHAALARGVYLPPSSYEVCFLSLAHDAPTLEAAADALAQAGRQAG